MADRNVNPGIEVVRPAESYDLLTLNEAKLLMGISPTDTSGDEQLQLFIDINSATIARMCNRIFAKETVRESWRDVGNRRIFLSHWPVLIADVESVESPEGTVLDPADWELEESSGKISNFVFSNGWLEPVVVNYTGGYKLPDEAPLPLKRAVALLNVQSKMLASVGLLAGIRQLSHKDSRVVFHDPSRVLEAVMGSKAGAPMQTSVMALIGQYIRYEV
jgi:hypothetical protein